MRTDTTELLTAERISPFKTDEPDDLESIISHLAAQPMSQSEPNVVSYLSYQQREGHLYILSTLSAGGTLYDFIQGHGALERPLVYSILRQVVDGLEQLQHLGYTLAFLDSRKILLDHHGKVKLEAPFLDPTTTPEQASAAVTMLPEFILGKRDMPKAYTWLFGIIAAQLLFGDGNIQTASSARLITAQMQQNPEESA